MWGKQVQRWPCEMKGQAAQATCKLGKVSFIGALAIVRFYFLRPEFLHSSWNCSREQLWLFSKRNHGPTASWSPHRFQSVSFLTSWLLLHIFNRNFNLLLDDRLVLQRISLHPQDNISKNANKNAFHHRNCWWLRMALLQTKISQPAKQKSRKFPLIQEAKQNIFHFSEMLPWKSTEYIRI